MNSVLIGFREQLSEIKVKKRYLMSWRPGIPGIAFEQGTLARLNWRRCYLKDGSTEEKSVWSR